MKSYKLIPPKLIYPLKNLKMDGWKSGHSFLLFFTWSLFFGTFPSISFGRIRQFLPMTNFPQGLAPCRTWRIGYIDEATGRPGANLCRGEEMIRGTICIVAVPHVCIVLYIDCLGNLI